ncbi:hypothetical protein VU01_11234 [Candidatus Electrothrix marina]|jgi:hypothetical protein|uniref:Uncharacterized protein n=1 Tax=Candidatus Electrothrix marina TaxID=1859130 RepID=A0A444JEK3_9BACT|nr:hypothetical protein VU01_11234 [Candidatus Electrothrix marina]
MGPIFDQKVKQILLTKLEFSKIEAEYGRPTESPDVQKVGKKILAF